MEIIQMPSDGSSKWAGMLGYLLISPDQMTRAHIRFLGEPPHGDSYHKLKINDREFPGFAWGCGFAFSSDSKYLVCSWMEEHFERKTVVIDCINHKYFVLLDYICNFRILWPKVLSVGSKYTSMEFEFNGT